MRPFRSSRSLISSFLLRTLLMMLSSGLDVALSESLTDRTNTDANVTKPSGSSYDSTRLYQRL